LIPAVDVTASTIRIKLYKNSYSIAMSATPGYAELHCLSDFGFQRGASQPEELVARAAAPGDSALHGLVRCAVPRHALRFYFSALWPEAEVYTDLLNGDS